MFNNIHWITFPQYESFLSEISLQNLDSHCIKDTPEKQVSEISFNGVSYILKVFKQPSLREKVKCFCSSRPRQEWNNLLTGKKLGLPVPEPIGYADTKKESYIITEKIASLGTLKDLARRNLFYSQKVNLIKNLAHAIAVLHKNQYILSDLHAYNILVDWDMNVYIINLYKLKKHSSENPDVYLKNTGMLGASIANQWKNSSDFVRFLHYYQEEWNALSRISFSNLYHKTANALQYYKGILSTKIAYRCLKNNNCFKEFYIDNGKGFVSRQCMPFDVTKESVRSYLGTAKAFKSDSTTGVYATPFGVYKEYRHKKKRNWLIDCFRTSRAKHSWLAGYHCIARGIPTATPILFWEKRKCRILFSSYLLMEEIKNAVTLRNYLEQESLSNIHEVLYKVGKFIRWMHEQGTCHRDLKSDNLLVTSEKKIILIDLDDLKVKTIVSGHRRQKDLQRLLRDVTLPKHLGKKERDIVVQGYNSLFYNALL